jgi:hypothetical protein
LTLLGPSGPPRSRIPRVRAEPGARLPAGVLAGARTVRRLPRGPVRPLRRIRGLPGSGVPRVLAVRSLASCPAGFLLRPRGLPGPGVPRLLAELPWHLSAARLSGAVRVGVAVRARDIRHLTGGLAVRSGHGRLAPAERTLTGLALAGRPRPVSLTELAWSWLSGGELTLPVAGLPRPRLSLPVAGLAGRPRLSLTMGTLLWPWPLPGTGPARTVLAGPRLPRGVLACTALALAGWHSARLTWHPGGRPLLSGLVSRWLPAASRSRRPPGRRPVLRSLPAVCLSGVGLGLPGEVLPLIPGLPGIPGPLRPRGVVGLVLAWPWRVRVRPWTLCVVETSRARAARWRRARLAGARLARGSLPRAGAGGPWPWAANARHRVLGTLPGRSRVVHRLPA